MAILNYTTTVAVETTLAVIHKLLVTHGATAILYEYDRQGQVEAVSFKVAVGSQLLPYRLPADWSATLTLLREDRKIPRRYKVEAQARRVSWRIVKDWLEAQLAFVAQRQVTMDQVFLPYPLLEDNRTLYQRLRERGYALPPARET